MGFRKTEAEKIANVRLDPEQNATAGRGLTTTQIVARQCKASDEKNKRRSR
jgi:hypothetical protein